ncbi:uncharacterized protein LOC134528025 [Bacillus rossius redtenbacheri]|uniref:uncharacterized protein LOC134528025 n=1 Tax=Bacillus rossius redtenbacheri TaxID=93214 RepID=UPI002FDEAC24
MHISSRIRETSGSRQKRKGNSKEVIQKKKHMTAKANVKKVASKDGETQVETQDFETQGNPNTVNEVESNPAKIDEVQDGPAEFGDYTIQKTRHKQPNGVGDSSAKDVPNMEAELNIIRKAYSKSKCIIAEMEEKMKHLREENLKLQEIIKSNEKGIKKLHNESPF